MRRAGLAWLVPVLVLVPAPAQAILVPSYPVEGRLPFTDLTGGLQDNQVAIFTGQTTVSGDARGLFTFAETEHARVSNVTRVEVYDTSGALGSINIDEFRRTGRPIHQSYPSAELTFGANSTFFYHTNLRSQPVNVSAPFAFGVALRPPSRLAPNQLVNLTTGPSFALVGAGRAELRWSAVGADAFLYAPDRNTNITVRSGSTVESFVGQRYLFRLLDAAVVDVVRARAFLVPLEGNTSIALRPAGRAALAEGFDLGRLNRTMATLLPNTTNPSLPIHPRIQQALTAVSPLFNGALVGNPRADLVVNGQNRTTGNLTVVRFDEARLRLNATHADRLDLVGRGPFLLLGDTLYSDKKAVGPAFFPLPALSIVLWFVAIVALVVRIGLKPFLPSNPANAAIPIRLAATITRWGLAVLAFVLWDLEARAFIGTSFLTLLFAGPRDGIAFGVVGLFQFLPYAIAGLLFGLPVRFLVNSVLRFANMKAARGVGKGLGYLSAWGLGAPYLPFLMAPVIGILADRIGAGLG